MQNNIYFFLIKCQTFGVQRSIRPFCEAILEQVKVAKDHGFNFLKN